MPTLQTLAASVVIFVGFFMEGCHASNDWSQKANRTLLGLAVVALEFLYFGQEPSLFPLSMPGLRDESGIENDISGAEFHSTVAPEQGVIFIHGKLVSAI